MSKQPINQMIYLKDLGTNKRYLNTHRWTERQQNIQKMDVGMEENKSSINIKPNKHIKTASADFSFIAAPQYHKTCVSYTKHKYLAFLAFTQDF